MKKRIDPLFDGAALVVRSLLLRREYAEFLKKFIAIWSF